MSESDRPSPADGTPERPDPVRYDTGGGAATLTLDSPHNRNAISTRSVALLRAGLDRAAADPDVRFVVLTHEGGTFCAGADLSEASGGASADPATAAAERTRAMVALLRAMLECPKPIVGVVDGHVRAGGMGFVGACDMVIAGPRATFALTEARLGLAASIISLTVVPRLAPRAAGRYFLTGERFDASEAERAGLVTVATDDVAGALAAVGAEFARCSPQGLAESKVLVTMRMLDEFDRYGERLAAQSARLFGTPEAIEGMTAFLTKRAPSWAPG